MILALVSDALTRARLSAPTSDLMFASMMGMADLHAGRGRAAVEIVAADGDGDQPHRPLVGGDEVECSPLLGDPGVMDGILAGRVATSQRMEDRGGGGSPAPEVLGPQLQGSGHVPRIAAGPPDPGLVADRVGVAQREVVRGWAPRRRRGSRPDRERPTTPNVSMVAATTIVMTEDAIERRTASPWLSTAVPATVDDGRRRGHGTIGAMSARRMALGTVAVLALCAWCGWASGFHQSTPGALTTWSASLAGVAVIDFLLWRGRRHGRWDPPRPAGRPPVAPTGPRRCGPHPHRHRPLAGPRPARGGSGRCSASTPGPTSPT